MTRRSEPSSHGDAAVTSSAGGPWRVRNWRLRTKLLAMLLIPAVAVLVLVALRAKADLDRATTFAEKAERVRVETTVVRVVHELQRERDLSVRYVAENRRGEPEELKEQRDRVDAAIGEFDKTSSGSAHALSPETVAAFEQIGSRLDVLTGLRYAGENTALPPATVSRSYSELISGLLDIHDRFVADTVDDELARSRLASNALARVKDQLSVRRAVVMRALAADRLDKDTERALTAVEARLDAAKDDFTTFAAPRQRQMYADTVIGLVVDRGNGIVESVLTRAETDSDLHGLSIDDWDTSATYTINLVKKVQDALLVELQQRSDALAADARRSAGTDAGVVLGALLIAIILAVVITRSLYRPLRALRSSALDVARNRLPAAVDDILAEEHPTPEHTRTRAVEPVPVFTREELGEVARAFDAVHGEAVRLAGEQAMLRENVNSMFVNLSRRSQELVERQLTVLDRMEEHEQDPDILGGLYELDHLATRMRRNSENLLVLAGEDDAGRPLPGSVPASEVIGAALSEVEHYQRISVSLPPSLSVLGDAAADLIHVISELFDNATRYSPESEQVTVASTVTRGRQWRIEITDRGASMPDTEIARANTRLANPPDVDVEVSRRMGLFVVGRLAARHDIRVTLAPAEPRGLTATVLVPAELVEHDVREPIALPPPSVVPPDAGFGSSDGAEGAHNAGYPGSDDGDDDELAVVPGPGDTGRPIGADSLIGRVLGAESGAAAGADRGGAVDRDEPDEPSPPRRKTVELGAQPAWPTEDDDVVPAALEEEVPTDRLPAYAEVLSRWFPDTDTDDPDAGFDPASGIGTDVRTDVGPGGADTEVTVEHGVLWPEESASEPPEVSATEITVPTPAVAATDPVGPVVAAPRTPAPRSSVVDRRGERPPPVNRSPEAVRERMASLQRGVRRGRDDLGE